jgi:hypothetical protein
MPNVVNHVSLAESGSARRCSIEDLSRLVWLWEWDGQALPSKEDRSFEAINDDPFVEIVKDWQRGGRGLIVTETTHSSRSHPKRVPAYGIGIFIDSSAKGMVAIAQWTGNSQHRRRLLSERLSQWVELHTKERVKQRENSQASSPTPLAVPNIPFSALPRLSSFNAALNSTSAQVRSLLDSPSRAGLFKSPTKKPFPTSSIPFPNTPSSLSSSPASSRPVSPVKALRTSDDPFARPITPDTPRQSSGIPQTPSTSRRQALIERVRLKSLNSTPTVKGSMQIKMRTANGAEIDLTIGPEEVQRRLLLGRLPSVAEAIWM